MCVEQVRVNLVIQFKYCDVVVLMVKFYLFGGKRKSLLGSCMSDLVKEVEMEKVISECCCEELVLELFYLEKGLMEFQWCLF